MLNSKSTKGWSKKGEECIIPINTSQIKGKGKRYTILAAVSNKKIIDFTVIEKGIRVETFLKFIKKLKNKDKTNKYSYLLDNAPVHHCKKNKSLFERIKNELYL
jgi:hypothetical protein